MQLRPFRILLFAWAIAIIAACGTGRGAASGSDPAIGGVYARSYHHGPIFLTLDVVNGRGTFLEVHHGMAFGFTYGSAHVSGDTLFLVSDAYALDRQQVSGCDPVTTYPQTVIMGCISTVEEEFFHSSDTLLVSGVQLVPLRGSFSYHRVGGSRLRPGN